MHGHVLFDRWPARWPPRYRSSSTSPVSTSACAVWLPSCRSTRGHVMQRGDVFTPLAQSYSPVSPMHVQLILDQHAAPDAAASCILQARCWTPARRHEPRLALLPGDPSTPSTRNLKCPASISLGTFPTKNIHGLRGEAVELREVSASERVGERTRQPRVGERTRAAVATVAWWLCQ